MCHVDSRQNDARRSSMSGAKWRILLLLVLSYFVVTVSGNAQSDESDERLTNRFLAEYRRAGEALEETYTRLKAAGTATILVEKRRGIPELVTHDQFAWAVRVRGDLLRFDQTFAMPQNRARHHAAVVSPNVTFSVEKGAEDEGFAVRSLSVMDSTWAERRMGTLLHIMAMTVPYCVYGQRIVDLIQESDVEVTALEESDVNGIPVVTLSYRMANLIGLPDSFQFSRLEFLPESMWALRSFKLEVRDKDTPEIAKGSRNALIEYSGAYHGVPLIKRCTIWSERRKGDTYVPNYREEYEVTELQVTNVPENQFRLTSFGIPEPAEVRDVMQETERHEDLGSWWPLTLLVIPAALLVLLWLKRDACARRRLKGD
jgi:hypothetical protein